LAALFLQPAWQREATRVKWRAKFEVGSWSKCIGTASTASRSVLRRGAPGGSDPAVRAGARAWRSPGRRDLPTRGRTWPDHPDSTAQNLTLRRSERTIEDSPNPVHHPSDLTSAVWTLFAPLESRFALCPPGAWATSCQRYFPVPSSPGGQLSPTLTVRIRVTPGVQSGARLQSWRGQQTFASALRHPEPQV
jgi:hypothetical protein